MKNNIGLALMIGTVLLVAEAKAGFIRVVPSIQVEAADKKPGVVLLSGTIENEGDETTLAVVIENARTNKILADVGTLGAGEKKEVSVEIAEKEIGVEKEGYYNIPLRVLYKDTNRASFSAAFINTFTKKNEAGTMGRSSPITLGLDEVVQKTGGVDIAKSGSFVLAVSNTGALPVDVNLEFIGTKEVELKIENPKLTLGPQEEKTVEVLVKNLSALPGSSYASYALVSGVIEGQSFSDYIGFVINIREKTEIPFMTWLLAALALIFAVIGYTYWRNDNSQEPKNE